MTFLHAANVMNMTSIHDDSVDNTTPSTTPSAADDLEAPLLDLDEKQVLSSEQENEEEAPPRRPWHTASLCVGLVTGFVAQFLWYHGILYALVLMSQTYTAQVAIGLVTSMLVLKCCLLNCAVFKVVSDEEAAEDEFEQEWMAAELDQKPTPPKVQCLALFEGLTGLVLGMFGTAVVLQFMA